MVQTNKAGQSQSTRLKSYPTTSNTPFFHPVCPSLHPSISPAILLSSSLLDPTLVDLPRPLCNQPALPIAARIKQTAYYLLFAYLPPSPFACRVETVHPYLDRATALALSRLLDLGPLILFLVPGFWALFPGFLLSLPTRPAERTVLTFRDLDASDDSQLEGTTYPQRTHNPFAYLIPFDTHREEEARWASSSITRRSRFTSWCFT